MKLGIKSIDGDIVFIGKTEKPIAGLLSISSKESIFIEQEYIDQVVKNFNLGWSLALSMTMAGASQHLYRRVTQIKNPEIIKMREISAQKKLHKFEFGMHNYAEEKYKL
jgi:hypothetical protein